EPNLVTLRLNLRQNNKLLDSNYFPGQLGRAASDYRKRMGYRFKQVTNGHVRFMDISSKKYRDEYYNRQTSSVTYFNVTERALHRIYFNKGLAFKISIVGEGNEKCHDYQAIDTQNSFTGIENVNSGYEIFVVNLRGEFFSSKKITNSIQHSSLNS